MDFTFMNLLIYLVYGREKSFDMHSLKAFKSLKAYKFYYDGSYISFCVPLFLLNTSTSVLILYTININMQ